jgi:hypothetical protein
MCIQSLYIWCYLWFCWFVDLSLASCVAVLNVIVGAVWRSAIVVIRGRCFCDIGCFDAQNAGRVVCCQLVLVSCTALNIGLCVSVFVSFICKWFLRSYICGIFPECLSVFLLCVFLWYSKYLLRFHIYVRCLILIWVTSIALIIRNCLCLVQNALPVCPNYFGGQSKHFIW